MREKPGALSHLRVLDLSRILAGPWASQVLGDMGADVIKVENPKGGDDTRQWSPPFLTEADGSERDAAYFTACNRNKRSVTIDFRTEKGADLIRRFAKESDVLIENYKVGGLARYGLDYASLKAINPRLVYCSITGFGLTGPYAERAGYDFMIQGMGGLMSITGQPDGTPGSEPVKVGVAVCDLFTGMYAATSILAALQHRDRTGEGQHIDLSLFGSQISMLANQASNWLVGGVEPGRMGNNHPNVVPYRVYPCQNGHLIIACGNDGQFAKLTSALGAAELAQDERFTTNAQRVRNRDAIDEAITGLLAERSRADTLDLLKSVGVPCGPINTIRDVFEDAHVREIGAEVKLNRPDDTEVATVAFPARFSETPARYDLAPPALGADTDNVLQEVLGLTTDDIDTLRQSGAIGTSERT